MGAATPAGAAVPTMCQPASARERAARPTVTLFAFRDTGSASDLEVAAGDHMSRPKVITTKLRGTWSASRSKHALGRLAASWTISEARICDCRDRPDRRHCLLHRLQSWKQGKRRRGAQDRYQRHGRRLVESARRSADFRSDGSRSSEWVLRQTLRRTQVQNQRANERRTHAGRVLFSRGVAEGAETQEILWAVV